MDTVKDRVLNAMYKILCTDSIELNATVDSLGLDSLDQIELIMNVEDEFDIEIPDEVTEKFKTIQDIITYIEKLDDEIETSDDGLPKPLLCPASLTVEEYIKSPKDIIINFKKVESNKDLQERLQKLHIDVESISSGYNVNVLDHGKRVIKTNVMIFRT